MSAKIKRKILPITDEKHFLEEGRQEFERVFHERLVSEQSKDNFDFIRLIGRGCMGQVLLAMDIPDGNYYAVKVINKENILSEKREKTVIDEKRILQALNHPFTVHLEFAFQDKAFIYIGMPYVPGGDLFVHLRRMKMFAEGCSRFFGAQVALALEYLHYCGLIYRDLKLENLIVDREGFLKLTDFGCCKSVIARTFTFCGTPDYIAPEVILAKSYNQAVDWWSFGVLIFELTAGYTPFHDRSEVKIYKKALKGKYQAPKSFSTDLKHLIGNLLQVDVTKRFGNLKRGVDDIKMHSWFKEIDWLKLLNKNVQPPFVPTLNTDDDISNSHNDQDTNWFEQPNDTIEVKVHIY